MNSYLEQLIGRVREQAASGLGVEPDEVQVDIANPKIGSDLAVPVFAFAGRQQKNPQELAQAVVDSLQLEEAERVEAISGFVNIWLKSRVLADGLAADFAQEDYGHNELNKDQIIVSEYSDPNPFKVLHAGHLYTSIVGDAISNLLRNSGANVHAVNYGGDVGLHVAKTMWAIIKNLEGEQPEKLHTIESDQRAQWLSERYVEGNNAYDDDKSAKAAIVELNKRIYQLHSDQDHDSPLAQLYWTTRQWSYDYFDEFYARIGTSFEKYYPESETVTKGVEKAKELLDQGVLKESDGAVIFPGEEHDLHTRVFMNSQGLPTYETKELGLILVKQQDYNFNQSIIITGNDITEYMKVVLKVIEQFDPQLSAATVHLTHGMVKLEGGAKMSSRQGNILQATEVLDAAATAAREVADKSDDVVVLGAVKFAFLKQSIGPDIIYNPKESVSLEGNSGPYVQYAAVRVGAVLKKAGEVQDYSGDYDFGAEKEILMLLARYPAVIASATKNFAPQEVAQFSYELARAWNRYYEKVPILESEERHARLRLLQHIRRVFEHSLGLLGMSAPENM